MVVRLRESIGFDLLSAAGVALLATMCLLAGARWWIAEPIAGPVAEGGWTRRSRAAFVPSGFHGTEFDTTTGRSFSWSREQSRLVFPALRRGRAYRVTLTVRGVRPPDLPEAEVTISVDGQVGLGGTVSRETSELLFEIPRAGHTGATVTIDTSALYRPGGGDPRGLGVIVDRVAIEPVNGAFVPAARSLGQLALAVFSVAVALRLCGLRGALWRLAATGVAMGSVWLQLQDGAFMGEFPGRLAWLGGGVLVAGAVVAAVRTKWPLLAGVPEWGTAVGLVLAICFIKIAVFAHPLAIVGDGIFQVHRAQVVHGGQFFFTSVTPKPFFEFPYPVALYVFALPFWQWFPTELDLLRLLRTITVVADVVAGLMLYGAVRRQWDNRIAAFAAAALWPLARAPLEALSNANLTNLFGQSLFAAVLAGVAWKAASSSASRTAGAALSGLLVIAFLSHFGTVTVGLAMMGTAVLALVLLGRGHSRRVGYHTFAIVLVALVASWLLYYSHFTEVYRRSWTAIAARESDDSSKMVSSPVVKLQRWWTGVGDDYGRPGVFVLLTTMVGVVILARQRRTGGSLVFLAWLAAWLALTALGILTPFTLRANLAAAPAFIVASALAIGMVASRGGWFRLAAWAAGILVAWDGWRVVTAALRLT